MAKSKDIEQLRAAVQDMDSISQHASNQIAAIADLVIIALETPTARPHKDTMKHAMQIIAFQAESLSNDINWRAEQVGCHWIEQVRSGQPAIGTEEVRHD